VFELVEAFCGLCDGRGAAAGELATPNGRPGTRLRLRREVLAGTWESLVSGQADLAIGVTGDMPNPGGIELERLGELRFVFCVAPHHRLAASTAPLSDAELVHERVVAVADTAQRLTPLTVGVLPGQAVLTVPSMRDKLEALLRGLGCGFMPEPLVRPQLEAGRLVHKATAGGDRIAMLHYAWRAERSSRGAAGLGRALQWWLEQLASPVTRLALIERHAGPLP
jgi:DNA-binding transcriptional LysR family regulator